MKHELYFQERGTNMGLPDIVAKLRFEYHGDMLDLNNVLNQLHLRSDEKAEKIAKKHVMIIFNDIFSRLGIDTSKLMKGEKEEL